MNPSLFQLIEQSLNQLEQQIDNLIEERYSLAKSLEYSKLENAKLFSYKEKTISQLKEIQMLIKQEIKNQSTDKTQGTHPSSLPIMMDTE